MKTLLSCLALALIIAFQSCAADNCLHITYNSKAEKTPMLIINQHVAFDTTANLLNITVVDQKTGTPIPNASITLTQQGQNQIDATTGSNGSYQLYKNGFAGLWDVTISHRDYQCLVIHTVEIGGGLYITAKLVRK